MRVDVVRVDRIPSGARMNRDERLRPREHPTKCIDAVLRVRLRVQQSSATRCFSRNGRSLIQMNADHSVKLEPFDCCCRD